MLTVKQILKSIPELLSSNNQIKAYSTQVVSHPKKSLPLNHFNHIVSNQPPGRVGKMSLEQECCQLYCSYLVNVFSTQISKRFSASQEGFSEYETKINNMLSEFELITQHHTLDQLHNLHKGLYNELKSLLDKQAKEEHFPISVLIERIEQPAQEASLQIQSPTDSFSTMFDQLDDDHPLIVDIEEIIGSHWSALSRSQQSQAADHTNMDAGKLTMVIAISILNKTKSQLLIQLLESLPKWVIENYVLTQEASNRNNEIIRWFMLHLDSTNAEKLDEVKSTISDLLLKKSNHEGIAADLIIFDHIKAFASSRESSLMQSCHESISSITQLGNEFISMIGTFQSKPKNEHQSTLTNACSVASKVMSELLKKIENNDIRCLGQTWSPLYQQLTKAIEEIRFENSHVIVGPLVLNTSLNEVREAHHTRLNLVDIIRKIDGHFSAISNILKDIDKRLERSIGKCHLQKIVKKDSFDNADVVQDMESQLESCKIKLSEESEKLEKMNKIVAKLQETCQTACAEITKLNLRNQALEKELEESKSKAKAYESNETNSTYNDQTQPQQQQTRGANL